MTRTLCLAALTCWTLAVPALADEDIEYPTTLPAYPFQRSVPTGQAVAIQPYHHLFRVRIYSTPQHDPYYNVPPYPVISPY